MFTSNVEIERRNRVQHFYSNDPLANLRIGVVLKKVSSATSGNAIAGGTGQENKSMLLPLAAMNPEKGFFWTGLISWQQKIFSPQF
jgi:hypothetical protein